MDIKEVNGITIVSIEEIIEKTKELFDGLSVSEILEVEKQITKRIHKEAVMSSAIKACHGAGIGVMACGVDMAHYAKDTHPIGVTYDTDSTFVLRCEEKVDVPKVLLLDEHLPQGANPHHSHILSKHRKSKRSR